MTESPHSTKSHAPRDLLLYYDSDPPLPSPSLWAGIIGPASPRPLPTADTGTIVPVSPPSTSHDFVQSPPPDALRTPAEAARKLGCSIKQPQKHKAKTLKPVPSPDTITATTPLRLDIAAQVAFPDGSVSVSGLRREIGRGNLRAEMIAGKMFTTLANIDDMRKKCAVPTKAPESSSENHGGQENRTDGSSSTAMPADVASSARQAHLRQIAQRLRASGQTPKKPSPTISDESTSRNSAAVIRLKSE